MGLVGTAFVAARRGVVNAKATQELYEASLKEEFREVHPICLWSHDHGLVHSNKQVKTLDDASALPLEYPGWMVDFQNARDPRGQQRQPTEAEIRAAAKRLDS